MQRVGRYEILGELGRGAMGVVMRAMDPVIGRTIAVKTIRFEGVDDPGDQQRLRDRLFREARSAGMISHPNIVTIYDIGQDGDLAYIAMEYVTGCTLDVLMRDQDRLDRPTVTNVLAETASALDYAHARGIIHRDIKPGNIMFTDAGSVKITDFGVAKITSHQVTKTDMVLGTPSYMSPEQIEGSRNIDGRADQFSLAVLAYEMLSGEKPFTGDSLPALLFKIARENAPAIHLVNPTLNEQVDAVLRRALSKAGADRFDTCSEFVSALHASLIGCPEWAPLARGIARDLPTMGPTMTEATPIPGTGSGTGAPILALSPSAAAPAAASDIPPSASNTPSPSNSIAASTVESFPTLTGASSATAQPFRASRRGVEEAEPSGSGIGKAFVLASIIAAVLVGGGLAATYFMGIASLDQLTSAIGITSPETETPPANPAPPAAVPELKPAASELPPAPPPAPAATANSPVPETPSPSPHTATPAASNTPFRTDGRAAEPRSAIVDIASTPAGARVTVDDTQEGCVTTPCSIELPAGRHVLRYALPNHRPGVSVILVPQETKASTVLDPASGTLLLITTPPGASVFVDGQPRGTTPASLKTPAGRHKVELKLPGLPDHSREIEVLDQQIVNIEVTWPGAQ